MKPTKQEQMQVIGITGGMGAGKSTVLSFLAAIPGVRVEEADRIGHLVMEPGTGVYERLLAHFGDGILGSDGRIDRPALARIVFSEESELAWLNQVIHPAVKDWFRREIRAERDKGELRVFFIEAALLIEDRYEELCGEFWYIYADPGVRKERLKASRGYSDEKIDAVFSTQLADAVFREHCRETIDNGGSPEETERQLEELLIRKGLYERKGVSHR